MANLTMRFTGTLTIETCGVCGVTFAAPCDLLERARRDHVTNFWCPLGHKLHYLGETEEQKLRRQLKLVREGRDWYQDQLSAANRSRSALKGQLTRARKKIAAGDCPVPGCGQHFANVREHMKFKHPEYQVTDPETGEAAEL